MISLSKLKKAMIYDGNGIYFTYKGLKCGMDINAHDSVYTFNIWFGTVSKEYDDFDKAINDPVFNGESIKTLLSSNFLDISFF